VLDLPVGELVRASLPVLGHAKPRLVGLGQRDQRLVHFGEVGGPAGSVPPVTSPVPANAAEASSGSW
jgi:hypothetical protein